MGLLVSSFLIKNELIKYETRLGFYNQDNDFIAENL